MTLLVRNRAVAAPKPSEAHGMHARSVAVSRGRGILTKVPRQRVTKAGMPVHARGVSRAQDISERYLVYTKSHFMIRSRKKKTCQDLIGCILRYSH